MVDILEFDVVCVIVNFGVGSSVLEIGKQNGVPGGTIILGMGTLKNPILEFLALADVRKEIVLMVAERSVADKALNAIGETFDLKKAHRGIAFSMSLSGLFSSTYDGYISMKTGADAVYNSIMVIVEEGNSEFVMEAAKGAGARGGTVIGGRGLDEEEAARVFGITIEPEKDVVLILSEASKTEGIVNSIKEKLKIGEPGNGIIFYQDVRRVIGLN